MNVKNAVGFFVLGTLMHVAPELFASATGSSLADGSIRAAWLEFMSWVVGGIGSTYLLREVVVRTPAMIAILLPERLLRPALAKSESMPAGAQVGISN